MQINTKIASCHTADSKPVKQEVNGTVLLPPLVFPGLANTGIGGATERAIELNYKLLQLSLSWLPPSDPLLDIDLYEVKYFIRNQKSNSSNVVITKKEMIEITGLAEGTEYGLQVSML